MALTDNIIAYYKTDESSGNATDATGNGYTLTNNNTVAYGTGKINNGADGGSSNSDKSLTNSSDVLTSSFSIAGWVNLTTAPGTDAAMTPFCAVGVTGTIFYRVQYFDDAGTKKLRAVRQKNGVADQAALINFTMNTGTWYHLAVVYDSAAQNLYLYKDGAEAALTGSVTGAGSTDRGNGIALLALKSTGGSALSENFTSGLVDEVGFWGRALTAGEITQLYNGGAGIQYPFTSANTGFFQFFG